ncbi:transmembrane 4 L6 family member 19 [Pelodytes ibericus]
MCVGKCMRFVGPCLLVLSILSIIVNILLLYPSFDRSYLQKNHIHTYLYAGIWAGGIMVLLIGIHTTIAGYKIEYLSHCAPRNVCCGSYYKILLCFGLSILGITGAIFSLCFVIDAVVKGPYCLYKINDADKPSWGYPFQNIDQCSIQNSTSVYVFDIVIWHSLCIEPPKIVPWASCLSIILFLINFLEIILCLFQMINACIWMICESCDSKKDHQGLEMLLGFSASPITPSLIHKP